MKKKEKRDWVDSFIFQDLRSGYPNEIPGDDVLEEENVLQALRLLIDPSHGGKGWRVCVLDRLYQNKPLIRVKQVRDGDSGGCSSTTTEFPITPKLSEKLILEGFVSGVPQWGDTSESKLEVTEWGKKHFYGWKEKKEEQEQEEAEKTHLKEFSDLYDRLPRPIT